MDAVREDMNWSEDRMEEEDLLETPEEGTAKRRFRLLGQKFNLIQPNNKQPSTLANQ